MKHIRYTALIILIIVLALANIPFSVSASQDTQQNSIVTASAVIVPAHVARLGFLITAPIKEINVNKGDVVRSGQTLISLNTPDLEYAVTAADAAYRSAAANAALQRYKKVRYINKGKIVWQDAPPEVRQIADAQAHSAQSRLEIAQFLFAQSLITAPFDGTVVDMKASRGEVSQQGQSVITLATLDNMIVETTDLGERDLLKVQIGAPVSITIEPLNMVITGKVISIAPKATIIGGDVVFKVTISLDEQPEGLLWGMTAEVTIGE